MNRIINQYGALTQNEVTESAEAALKVFEDTIRGIINGYSLNPTEIRCLCACMHPSVFAEETLRAAMEMKKAERGTAQCWLKIPYNHLGSTTDKVEEILARNDIPFKRCDGRTWECYRKKDWVEKAFAGQDIGNTYQIHD